MSYETNDNMTGTEAASDEWEVHNSASSLALGLGLLFGGVAAVLLGNASVFVGANGSVVALAWIFGGMAIIVGVLQSIVGVYQCAQNIDRATKILFDGQRAGQKPDASTAP